MSEDPKKEVVEEESTEMETIKELLEKVDKMVEPEKFAELETKYKTLLNDYVNRRPVKEKPTKELRPANEIANELRNISDGDITNRNYIKKSLEYRESYIAEKGKDPWTDPGVEGHGTPTAKTIKIAKAYKQLLEENPTDHGFNIAFHEVLKDDNNVLAVLRKRKKK